MSKIRHSLMVLSLLVPLAVEAGAAPSFRGGFSSHAAPAPQKNSSMMSRQLGRQAAQANALRTLDARRTPPPAAPQPQPMPMPAPAPVPHQPPAAPTTVIVQQGGGGSGIGHMVAGALIARAASAHAQPGYGYGYPAPAPAPVAATAPAPVPHGGGSVFSTIAWLGILALLGCGAVVAWRRVRSRRAQQQPHYTFERN